MKISVFILTFLGLCLALNAQSSEHMPELESLLPAIKQGRSLVPIRDNPYRRVVSIRRTESPVVESGPGVEGMVKSSFGGARIGGVLNASKYFRGGVVIDGVMYEVGEEIVTYGDTGAQVPALPGFRSYLREVNDRGVVFEVYPVVNASQEGSVKVTVSLEEYFR